MMLTFSTLRQVMAELDLHGASSQGWETRPSYPSGGFAGGSVPLGHRTPSVASASSSTGGFGTTASSAQHMRQIATVQAFRARSRAFGHEVGLRLQISKCDDVGPFIPHLERDLCVGFRIYLPYIWNET